ncbi:MAG: molybdopterin oxidoreductase family protein, partial [Chloroflexus sp.]|nr:molybdopterin oxidoreductase family protein [Chloroflexus sp.]
IRGVLDASRAHNPFLADITFERLQREGTVRLTLSPEDEVPFANGHFPTPSGKVELWSATLAAQGLDPLPHYEPPTEYVTHPLEDGWLTLISAAPHHFVSSSMANQPSLRRKEGEPQIEINPVDAAARNIRDGETVIVINERGQCCLRAVISTNVPVGVVAATKGHWASLSPDGRNVNWTTPDALADLGGQSTFHSNRVQIRAARP